MSTYRVHFRFGSKDMSIDSKCLPEPYQDFETFKHGFWVTRDMFWSAPGGEDAKYWIPHHKIEYVEKVEGNE